MYLKICFICLFGFCFAIPLLAQRPSLDTSKPEGKLIEVQSADRLTISSVDSLHKYTSLAGKVHVKQDKTDFFADSAVINEVDNSLEAFGHIHINDADSVHTYADYLKYLGREKKAFLKNNVRLTDGKGVLTSSELTYDVTIKIGAYTNGGKLVNKKTVLTSKEGYYYGDTKDVIFKNKVVLNDPQYKVVTDTLQYNTNTEIANFISPTKIYSDNDQRIIYTKQGFFDLKNKKGILSQRSIIDDSSYTFTADEMAVDDSTGLSEFKGNAVYRGKDTAKGYDMIANNIKTDQKKDILLATQKPILLIKQGADTIYISADTFYTARLTNLLKIRPIPSVRELKDSSKLPTTIDSTVKYFEAYFHVKIFSDSLQAVGDSLFYSLQDSVFRLFSNPIIWAKENQISGDTIYLFVKNKQPERLWIFENSMMISRVDSTQYFNQLKSNSMNALFEDGKIHYLRAKGSAENIYYGQDEKAAFIGVNKSSSDIIDVYFEDSKLKKVHFIRDLEGTMYPMRQVLHDELKIKGFKWLEKSRPKSKFDILTN